MHNATHLNKLPASSTETPLVPNLELHIITHSENYTNIDNRGLKRYHASDTAVRTAAPVQETLLNGFIQW